MQAAKRAEKCHCLSLVSLIFDLQTSPSERPNTSSVWIWHKSVQQFRRYFIHKQKKPQTDGTKNRTFRRSLCVVKISILPSVLWHCLLGGRKSIRPEKLGDGGGEHCLVRTEWRPAGRSVCLPLLIFPCTIKCRSSLLAPANPGGPGKRVVKRFCVCVRVRKWWIQP